MIYFIFCIEICIYVYFDDIFNIVIYIYFNEWEVRGGGGRGWVRLLFGLISLGKL